MRINLKCSYVDETDLDGLDKKAFFRGLYGMVFGEESSKEDYEEGQRIRAFDDNFCRYIFGTLNPALLV